MVAMIMELDLDPIGLEVVMVMEALDMVTMTMVQDLTGLEVDMTMEALDMAAMIMELILVKHKF